MLNNYRQTPHPATGIPPADMMFRDGYQSSFPRRTLSNKEIMTGKQKDKMLKLQNEELVNSSKYRKKSTFEKGDQVLVRNYNKRSKFDPIFLPEPFIITDINEVEMKITVKQNGKELSRHPDDLKPFHGYRRKISDDFNKGFMETEEFKFMESDDEQYSFGDLFHHQQDIFDQQQLSPRSPHQGNINQPLHDINAPDDDVFRRSNRAQRKNIRYFNDDFIT